MFSLTRTIKYLNVYVFIQSFGLGIRRKFRGILIDVIIKRTICTSSSCPSSVITTSENWGRLKLTYFAFIVILGVSLLLFTLVWLVFVFIFGAV